MNVIVFIMLSIASPRLTRMCVTIPLERCPDRVSASVHSIEVATSDARDTAFLLAGWFVSGQPTWNTYNTTSRLVDRPPLGRRGRALSAAMVRAWRRAGSPAAP